MKDTLGVLLAGGAGERLYPLTRDRAKPAVTFGGMYRIIDITLSNCLNSDLRRVYILTQYKALSLNRHIREGWNILGREVKEFIEVLPPMKRVSDQWYQGTADAVYQNIYSIGSEQPKHVLILSGDHIYKMNYGKMMKQHLDSAADITLATIQIAPEETSRFGVVDVDKDGRINGFEEKPAKTELRSPWNSEKCAGSMGVYLFNASDGGSTVFISYQYTPATGVTSFPILNHWVGWGPVVEMNMQFPYQAASQSTILCALHLTSVRFGSQKGKTKRDGYTAVTYDWEAYAPPNGIAGQFYLPN